jgi:hypothetical protein
MKLLIALAFLLVADYVVTGVALRREAAVKRSNSDEKWASDSDEKRASDSDEKRASDSDEKRASDSDEKRGSESDEKRGFW